MSVTTESRAAFVVESDAKLRVTASMGADNDVMVTVEIRRGVAESLWLTMEACELLRVVHDSVYVVKYEPK